MKKFISALIVSFPLLVSSQVKPFASPVVTTKGLQVQAGILTESGPEFQMSFQFVPSVPSKTSIAAIQIGWHWKVFTPLAGLAYTYYENWEYVGRTNTGDNYQMETDIKPIVGIEIRPSWWFLSYSLCGKQHSFGIGLKLHQKF